jgi:signal transduction histidine kinase
MCGRGYDKSVARRPMPLLGLTALVACTATVLVMAVPTLHFAYRSASLHVAFEVAAALIALLAAYLVYTRARDTRRLDDVVLVTGLAMMAGSNFLFAALPASLPELDVHAFSTWAAIGGRLVSAVLIAAAAWLPEVALRRASVGWIAIAATGAALGTIAVAVASVYERLPEGIDPALSPTASASPHLEGHPLVHAVQLVAFALFAAAAIGFGRRAHERGSEFSLWLANACVVGAFARVHYFLFPSLYSEWVYTGDFFRLGFYVLLVIGAAREIARFQRGAAAAAVLDERRRLARELHDGVAQELGFIAVHAERNLATGRATDELGPVLSSARRGVDEARRAIAALTRPVDEPLDFAIADAVEDLEHRLGARVQLDLEPDVHVDADAREQLLRIVREAVANAARHANGTPVRVELRIGDGVRLRIDDDGPGFDPDQRRPGRHGLSSMRERARTLGVDLRIESSARRGTSVEVVLPRSR